MGSRRPDGERKRARQETATASEYFHDSPSSYAHILMELLFNFT
jgi:hypothetical protein